MTIKYPILLLLILILSAAGSGLLSASAQHRAIGTQDTAQEAVKNPQATRQILKIQRFSIPYGKHRLEKHYQSPPPSMHIDYRRVLPLPESGHNYLKDYYNSH